MAEQVRAERTSRTVEPETESGAPPPPQTEERAAHLAEIDDLLDEIDAVLESEEFVKTYVQSGGE